MQEGVQGQALTSWAGPSFLLAVTLHLYTVVQGLKIQLHPWFCMLLNTCEPYCDAAEKEIAFPSEACVSGTNEVFSQQLSLLLLEMSNSVQTDGCFPGTL